MYKIAIIEPVGGHGGNEFYDFGLCEHLQNMGQAVTLYTCDETYLDIVYVPKFIVKKSYKAIYGDTNKIIRGIRYLKGTLFSLFDSLKKKTNIAHFHIYHFSILEVFNISLFKLFGITCVATIHDVESFDKYGTDKEKKVSIKAKFLLNMCNGLMVHSHLALEALRNMGISEKKIHLVRHGDTDFIYNRNKLSQAEARTKLLLTNKKKILLFFGQIKAVKGLDILLKAVPFLNESIDVLVVGKCWKQELDVYMQIVRDLKIEHRVDFVNKYIPNEDVPLYFWSSDFVCLPYKKIYSSGVVLRAMDYGTTVISSNLEPLLAVVKNEENGLIFQSESPSDLASVVNKIAKNDEKNILLAQSAKKYIDENYSWDIVARDTLLCYESFIKKQSYKG